MSQDLRDSAVVVATVAAPFVLGQLLFAKVFQTTVQVNRRAVKNLFSLTFALSVDILILAVYEIAGVLQPGGTRLLTWRIVFGLLIGTLTVVLPVSFVLILANDLGVRPRTARFLAVIAEAVFLWVFWRLGSFFPIVEKGDHDLLSFEGSIGRLGVAGVTASAILSGFGSISTPYQYLAALIHPVLDSDVKAQKKHVRNLLNVVLRQQTDAAMLERKLSEARDKAAGMLDGDSPMGTPSRAGSSTAGSEPFSSAGGHHQHRRRGRSSTASQANIEIEDEGFLSKALSYVGVSNLLGRKSGKADPVVAQLESDILNLRKQIATTEAMQQEEFRIYLDLLDQQKRRDWSRTWIGRFFTYLGYALSVYAVYKLLMSFANIVLRRDPTKDPVTSAFEWALVLLSVPRKQAEMYVQPVSFVFVGTLVFTSVRGFLMSLSQLFSAFSRSLGLSPVTSASFVLLLAEVMGMYFVSVLLLLRMSMPEEYRRGVSTAIGAIHFNFFHRWFDVIFLLSGCVSIVVVMMTAAMKNNSSRMSKADRDAMSASTASSHRRQAAASASSSSSSYGRAGNGHVRYGTGTSDYDYAATASMRAGHRRDAGDAFDDDGHGASASAVLSGGAGMRRRHRLDTPGYASGSDIDDRMSRTSEVVGEMEGGRGGGVVDSSDRRHERRGSMFGTHQQYDQQQQHDGRLDYGYDQPIDNQQHFNRVGAELDGGDNFASPTVDLLLRRSPEGTMATSAVGAAMPVQAAGRRTAEEHQRALLFGTAPAAGARSKTIGAGAGASSHAGQDLSLARPPDPRAPAGNANPSRLSLPSSLHGTSNYGYEDGSGIPDNSAASASAANPRVRYSTGSIGSNAVHGSTNPAAASASGSAHSQGVGVALGGYQPAVSGVHAASAASVPHRSAGVGPGPPLAAPSQQSHTASGYGGMAAGAANVGSVSNGYRLSVGSNPSSTTATGSSAAVARARAGGAVDGTSSEHYRSHAGSSATAASSTTAGIGEQASISSTTTRFKLQQPQAQAHDPGAAGSAAGQPGRRLSDAVQPQAAAVHGTAGVGPSSIPVLRTMR